MVKCLIKLLGRRSTMVVYDPGADEKEYGLAELLAPQAQQDVETVRIAKSKSKRPTKLGPSIVADSFEIG